MMVFNFGRSLPDWEKKSTGIPNFQSLNEVDVIEVMPVGSKCRRYFAHPHPCLPQAGAPSPLKEEGFKDLVICLLPMAYCL
jgi:hypothetical protein